MEKCIILVHTNVHTLGLGEGGVGGGGGGQHNDVHSHSMGLKIWSYIYSREVGWGVRKAG